MNLGPGISKVEKRDKIINPYSWNTVLVRGGKYYSVNHYPAGKTHDTGNPWKPERVEMRYEIDQRRYFEQLGINPDKLGIKFDKRGYRK
jgi:hypothetical protein